MKKWQDIDQVKLRIYQVVEASHDGDVVSRHYDLLMLAAIVVGLVPLTLKATNPYTKAIDVLAGFLFLVDYCLRVFTSDYKMGIKSYKAYLAYAFSPLAMVDLLSILPILELFLPSSKFGLFRIFRVLMVLKLVRYSKAMITIVTVIRKVKRQLMAVLVLAIVYIGASAMVIFQLEPDSFNNFFDALYWATISITTIGYGDISPTTSIGRFITMVSALVGVAVIALPSGIITAAYMDEIKKVKGKHEL